MLVGVPKEIKTHEYRVGLTTGSVSELIHHGHKVIVETNAGAGIGLSDEMYRRVGAEIVARVAAEAFDWLDAPPLRIAQADAPLPYAANLEALALPSVERIVEAALKVCYR